MSTTPAQRQYKAFISYAHADEHWAAWLQRSLEKYHVPRKLSQAYPGRKRLNPIFRDKEELASSTDLGDSIRSAMVQSEALVVVCSPAAAASKWVNEEIHCFRDLVPGGKILCCLVEGNPDPGSPNCAFPRALLENRAGEPLPEPLAADVRDSGDGKRGAFLKIAAGLLQVGIDDLRQRDLQRRIRLLGAVALGAVVVSVVTAGLAIATHLARQESELRRTQAENLIDFMLVELRDQLEPIGKLDILDSVGDQALEYFAALGDRGTPDEIFARAMALRQIGEVRFNEGRFEPALEAFSDSRDVAAVLHRDNPDNNDYLFELGQSEFWVGYVAWERGDLEGASMAFEQYMAHTRDLLALEPDNQDYQLELMYAHSNLGSVASEAGRGEKALDHFTISTEIAESLTEENPTDADAWTELQESQSWLGDTFVKLGRLEEAQSSYQRAVDSGQRAYALAQIPSNQYNVATELLLLSTVHMHLGKPAAALESLQVSQQALRELVAFDNQNARWQRDFARTHFRLAEAYTGLEDFENAMFMAGIAHSTFTKLANQDPGYKDHQVELASLERLQAWHRHQDGDLEAALVIARRANNRVQDLLSSVSMQSLQVEAALVAEMLGRLQAFSGDTAAAWATWTAGLEILPAAAQCDLLQAAARLLLLKRLGLDQENELLIDKIESANFADPRFQETVITDRSGVG